MKIIQLIIIFLLSSKIFAQLSPPGLGDTNAASWYAMGLKQNIDSTDNIESMTYIGLGLKSGEDNYDFASKPAIVVLNEEIYHHLNDHWKISYAGSYRKQMDYSMDTKTNVEEISTQQELRLYARVSYSNKINKIKFTQTLRQEARKFVDKNWKNTDEPFQLRTRFKTQVAVDVNDDKQHTLTAGAEVLFSSSRNDFDKKWSDFGYNESRFTLFYTYRPKETPIAISLGYMNNLIKKNTTHSVHYASVDIVLENPFHIFS